MSLLTRGYIVVASATVILPWLLTELTEALQADLRIGVKK